MLLIVTDLPFCGVPSKPEVYKAKDSTGFAGKIVDVAANGNFYVEVEDPGDAVLLLQVPMIYEEYTTAMQHESNFCFIYFWFYVIAFSNHRTIV